MDVEGIYRGLIKVNGEGLRKMINKTDNYVMITRFPPGKTRYMGARSFPGVEQLRRGIDYPPPSSAKVEGRVQLYICSPSGPSWPVLGLTLPPFFFTFCTVQMHGSKNIKKDNVV